MRTQHNTAQHNITAQHTHMHTDIHIHTCTHTRTHTYTYAHTKFGGMSNGQKRQLKELPEAKGGTI